MRNKTHYSPVIVALLLVLAAGCSAPGASQVTPSPVVAVPVTSTTETPAQPAPTAVILASPTAAQATAPAATSSQPANGMLTFAIVPEKSEARYRVREQLANRDLPNDAIGKTNQISGSISVKPDGTIDSANSKITVDLSTLQTDQRMRDNYVRRSILQTDQYPNATFVPKTVEGLTSPLPQSGQVTFKVTGDLTIRDVTKPVTWDVTGTVNGSQATGTAKTSFKFEDFNLSQPRVPVVLGVENNITLEADVVFQQSGS